MAWQKVYEHDGQGERISGSKEVLSRAIWDGRSIKIGFPQDADGDLIVAPAMVAGIINDEVHAQTTWMVMGAGEPGFIGFSNVPGVYMVSASTSGMCMRRILTEGNPPDDMRGNWALVWFAETA